MEFIINIFTAIISLLWLTNVSPTLNIWGVDIFTFPSIVQTQSVDKWQIQKILDGMKGLDVKYYSEKINWYNNLENKDKFNTDVDTSQKKFIIDFSLGSIR